jgi:ribosomal subunit interface protein
MQITVTGRHFEITDALRQRIENKIHKLDRYLDGITDVHVVILLRLFFRQMGILFGALRRHMICIWP